MNYITTVYVYGFLRAALSLSASGLSMTACIPIRTETLEPVYYSSHILAVDTRADTRLPCSMLNTRHAAADAAAPELKSYALRERTPP